jgi:hypothetical protein
MEHLKQTAYELYKNSVVHPDRYNVHERKVFYTKVNDCSTNLDVYTLLIEYTKIAMVQIKQDEDFIQTRSNIFLLIEKLVRTEFRYKTISIRYIFNSDVDKEDLYAKLQGITF